jgi:putative tryptophan/tyrosine transport system substrate-binding protein
MRRRAFIAGLGATASVWPRAARAQQVRRIGVLMGVPEKDAEGQARIAALQKGLRELGWHDGRNLRIEYRWAAADAERARLLAVEMIGLGLEVIVANSTAVVAALQQQTKTTPVIFIVGIDAVASGFVSSLAKPGGNITGLTTFEPEMSGKWLGLLKEMEPKLARVALMYNPATQTAHQAFFRSVQAAASALSVETATSPVGDRSKIADAITTIGREPNSGLIVVPDVFTSANANLIIERAAQLRLPAIYPFTFFARNGGLVSYGVDVADLFRRSAPYVDRILKGERPADLPVQTPNKFQLAINLKTAKVLGLDISPSLLTRADEVIE